MKDTKLWFKAKRYGWGWYPVSIEGWITLALYLAIIIPIFIGVDAPSHSLSDTLINFSLPFIGLTSLLLAICYTKGEHPMWKWGSPIPEASRILKEIKAANSILLHCHPSPDPDSVGSSLAMKFALESMGKKVTVIRGDSEIPRAFMHFPGAREIVEKSFSEIDLTEFDLFIIQDSASPEMISRKDTPIFPLSIKTIVIDHHASNKGYALVNLIDPSSPSVTYILYALFKEWNIPITPSIAANLFIGMYTDTGGFRFSPTNYKVLEVAADLTKTFPDYTGMIFAMENSQEKDAIYGQALALSSLQTFYDDHLVVSAVSLSAVAERKILVSSMSEGYIANVLKSVIGWDIAVSMVEIEPGRIKVSFRTRDVKKYDVSKIATELGGGGHKGAAGAVLKMSLDDAVKKVVETAKIIYNL